MITTHAKARPDQRVEQQPGKHRFPTVFRIGSRLAGDRPPHGITLDDEQKNSGQNDTADDSLERGVYAKSHPLSVLGRLRSHGIGLSADHGAEALPKGRESSEGNPGK